MNIFSILIADEEGHADWLQTRLDRMDKLGEGRYLSSLVSSMGAGAIAE